MQKPSEHVQTVAVSYHVGRVHRGWLGNKAPELHNVLFVHRMTLTPRGVILGWVTIGSEKDR
jgi:hypothetical protein